MSLANFPWLQRACCVLAPVWLAVAAASPLPALPPAAADAAPLHYAQALSDDANARLAMAQALRQDLGVRGLLLLWLLSFDAAPQVVQAAADSAVALCARQSASVCAASLGAFLGPEETGPAYTARVALAWRQPSAALAGASQPFRLQLVAQAHAGLGLPGHGEGRARLLRRLAEDPDPEVQEAAGAALMQLER